MGGKEMEITAPGRDLESWKISTWGIAQLSLVNQQQPALLCSSEMIR